MRIALVSAHVSPLAAVGATGSGSQVVHVAELAAELGRRGHRVTIYTRKDSATLPDRVRTGPGVTVEHVPAGPTRALPPYKQLPYMAQFGAYLADRWLREQPDIVHAHFWISGLAALTGARDLGLPVVQTFHGLGVAARRHEGAECNAGGEGEGSSARIRLEVAIARGVNAVLATTSDEAFELARLGVPRNAVSVVPSGVDVEKFSPEGPVARRDGCPRLVCVGQLGRHDGLDETMSALSSLPESELLIIGGPPKPQLRRDREYRRLAKHAKQLGVTGQVKFCGRAGHQDMPALLRSADLVVCVPWYTSSGLVPLEAMACGTPVVASAVGGHTDTVVDGTTGVLVPPRQPQVLARRIRELLASPMLRQGYGIAGADRARARYSWPRIAQETVTGYDRIRRTRPRRHLVSAGTASAGTASAGTASAGTVK